MTRLTLDTAATPFPMPVAPTRSALSQRSDRTVAAADAAAETRAPICPIAPDVVDLDSELGYWRGHYRGLPGGSALRYGDYEPAVKLGLDAYMRARGRRLDDMEHELEICYRRTRGLSRLDWEQARAIVRLAWNHLHLRGLKE
ncbi:hypothetical protein ACI2IY_09115 [Lysobacter enzymogenes]|uniref:hypothetical protein n=1 Tax=Lysobacter enzymogenes TaxID=69 RepID=UPI00384DF492